MTTERPEANFERPAEYWLRRAHAYRDSGDLLRASALTRHATRLKPADPDMLADYAEQLSELGCYDASNREAFAALALAPERFTLYGLVAQNLSRMGRRRQAMDAYSLFLSGGQEQSPDFDAWEYPYDIPERYDHQPRRRARLDGLLNVAERRLARGDWKGAGDALCRASERPYKGGSARRDALWARLALLIGQPAWACLLARAAIRRAPRSTVIACSAARVFAALGKAQAGRAGAALLRAAFHMSATSDEALVCDALDAAGQLGLLKSVLLARFGEHPDRFATGYNAGVCLLKLGETSDASPFLHLCREFDPEDMCAESLLTLVEDWKERGLTSDAVRELARDIPYYGKLLPDERERMLKPVQSDARRAPHAFAKRAQDDAMLRRRYLRLLALPQSGLGDTLARVQGYWPPETCEPFMRELLTEERADDALRAFAIRRLIELDAKPPFAVRRPDSLRLVDPSHPPAPDATFMQRQLVRRLRQAAKYVRQPRFELPALRLVSRMSWHQRTLLVRNDDGMWPMALAMLVCHEHGLVRPLIDPFERITPERIAALRHHARALRPNKQGG